MRLDHFQDHRNQCADVTSWRPFAESRTATSNKSDKHLRTIEGLHRDNKCHNMNILSQEKTLIIVSGSIGGTPKPQMRLIAVPFVPICCQSQLIHGWQYDILLLNG